MIFVILMKMIMNTYNIITNLNCKFYDADTYFTNFNVPILFSLMDINPNIFMNLSDFCFVWIIISLLLVYQKRLIGT